jgi:hypothetical protein
VSRPTRSTLSEKFALEAKDEALPRKPFAPEQLIAKLRQIEITLATGRTLPQASSPASP